MTKKEQKAILVAEQKKLKAELADLEKREKKHGPGYGAISRHHRRRSLVAQLGSLEIKARKLDAAKG